MHDAPPWEVRLLLELQRDSLRVVAVRRRVSFPAIWWSQHNICKRLGLPNILPAGRRGRQITFTDCQGADYDELIARGMDQESAANRERRRCAPSRRGAYERHRRKP